MTTSDKLVMPGSGYNKVTKIIHGYLTRNSEGLELNEIASRSGIHRDVITRSNGFLTSVGIIGGGNQKSLTARGRKLALAIEHDDSEEIKKQWRGLVQEASVLEPIIQLIKVQKKATKSVWESKILQALELKTNTRTGTGIACLLTILEIADIVKKDGQEYSFYNTNINEVQEEHGKSEGESRGEVNPELPGALDGTKPAEKRLDSGHPSVHIDIQIHISSDAKPDQIDQIFASMAKHLYDKQ